MQHHVLSKSTFMRGVQCQKSLYLNKFHKDLRDSISDAQEAIFASGTNVGQLAQELFPEGVDCTPEHFYNWLPSIEKTKILIENGQEVIYEAAFQFDGVLAAIDILVKRDGKWYGYEVKGSTSVKDYHKQDISLQYYVIRNSGLVLEDIGLLHLNNEYVKNGDLDINELFAFESLIEVAKGNETWVKNYISKSKSTLKGSEVPEIEIGPHCSDPFTCDFSGNCWKNIPSYSVFNLYSPRGREWELYNQGIIDIKDIPVDFDLTSSQQVQVRAEKTGEEIINENEIRSFLDLLNYPLYHFDFETFTTPVPIFDQSRPYQQLPFQYSLHIQDEINSEPIHKEFLADPINGDPRIMLIEKMLNDLGNSGDILVYNKSFEDTKIKELARDFPEHASRLNSLRDRIVDLAKPFMKKHYYTKEMKGRYSIKYILPALIPELSYNDLEIKEGGTASRIFTEMMLNDFNGDKMVTREHLLAYCKLDTLAMVKILEKLYQI